jgi:hypothetical protein
VVPPLIAERTTSSCAVILGGWLRLRTRSYVVDTVTAEHFVNYN